MAEVTMLKELIAEKPLNRMNKAELIAAGECVDLVLVEASTNAQMIEDIQTKTDELDQGNDQDPPKETEEQSVLSVKQKNLVASAGTIKLLMQKVM